MKKLFTLLVFAAFYSLTFGQVQRMILAEEFTQASCPPCASHNPPYHALLDANPTKIIGLNYQVNWPGTDPMNVDNPLQVATRVAYYGVSGVPHGIIDGTAIFNDCGSWTGAPLCLSQAEIDAEYAIGSPFTLIASHSFSADYDSIFISVTITAAQAFTATSALRAHVAIVEREILFTSPPGSNGETDFPWVMRRMLPTDQGTTLGLSWTIGQTQTITFSSPLPWYIRNTNEIGVVTFIQESNSVKQVHQAAYSAHSTIASTANDVSVPFVNVPASSCNPVAPVVTLRNTGTTTLTSADIRYQYDLSSNWYYVPSNSFSWTGSVAPNGIVLVTLPSTTLAGSGAHTLTVNAISPNGAVDINPYNGYKTTTSFIAYSGIGSATPVAEGFTAILFPPTNWQVYNPDASYAWIRYPAAGGFGNSATSTKMNFYSSPSGQIDDLILPAADLQWASPGIILTFSVAYAQRVAQNDKLQVQVSTNCGTTWTTVYDKMGAALSTRAPYSTGAWIPTASDWRSDTVNLDSYVGNNDVLIRFRATSNLGNNLYVDDVNLQFITGINTPVASKEIDVYPNPTNGVLNINLNTGISQHAVIKVYNSLGEAVREKELTSNSSGIYSLNLSGLPSGNYIVQVINDRSSTLHKISLTK